MHGSNSANNRPSPSSISRNLRNSSSGEPASRDVRPKEKSSQVAQGPLVDGNIYPCGTCNINVGNEDALECDRCLCWTHAVKACSGLPVEAFKTIHKYSSSGATYVCTSCRLKPSSKSSGSGDYSQLFEIVRGLSSSIQKMSEEICSLKAESSSSPKLATTQSGQNHLFSVSGTTSSAPSGVDIRRILHEEAREVREREKRVKSVIIRGLGDSQQNIQEKFNEVVDFLFEGERKPDIVLSDVVPINPNLIRAKIVDDSLRRNLLIKAKDLKDSQFAHVHLKRDLTFQQREIIKKRITSRESQIGSSGGAVVSSVPNLIGAVGGRSEELSLQTSPSSEVANLNLH